MHDSVQTTQSLANPFSDLSGLPRWAEMTPETVAPAVQAALSEAHNAVQAMEQLTPEQITWDNFVEYLNDKTEQLSRIWGAVTHLHHVVDNEQWREQYNATTLLHGHTHRPGEHADGGFTRWVLPDWDLDNSPHRWGYMSARHQQFELITHIHSD